MEKKILFVDDEENILKSLRRIFVTNDYDVLTAVGGKAALELIDSGEKPAVIVSDQRMPEMNGAEFLSKAKEKLPESIRIILTGYADINAAMDSINLGGVYRYILKPWNDEDLLCTIKGAFELYALRSENKVLDLGLKEKNIALAKKIEENEKLLALTNEQNKKLFDFSTKMKQKVQEQTEEIVEKNKALEAGFFATIRAFSSLMDSYAPASRGHGQRVARLACEIAKRFDLSPDEIVNIEIASILHDIGKMSIPQSILDKNRKLSEKERMIFEGHAASGQEIVGFIDRLDDVGRLIRSHHERYDGNGYPDSLLEDKIPLGARIIAAADAFDNVMHFMAADEGLRREFFKEKEVTQDHVGEEELRKQMALFYLKKNAFSRFDPDVVKETANYFKLGGMVSTEERIVEINKLVEGMELARPLFTEKGLSLLPYKTILTQNYIDKLQRIHKKNPVEGGVAHVVKK